MNNLWFFRDNFRAIGLYWVGSFVMRSIIYLLGNAVGKYSRLLFLYFFIYSKIFKHANYTIRLKLLYFVHIGIYRYHRIFLFGISTYWCIHNDYFFLYMNCDP